MGRLARLVLLALAVSLFMAAAPALGATQYASPTGSALATDCTDSANPCSIDNAFANAGDNDEISLAAGTYSPIAQLGMGRSGLDVHGPIGTQSVRINADTGGAALTIDTGHLHDLSISNSNMAGQAVRAFGAGTGSAGVVENVEIEASGTATGIIIGSESPPGVTVLRNSVILSQTQAAVFTQGPVLIQNVDAYASSGSSAVGILVSGGGTTHLVSNVVNSIARGSDPSRDIATNGGTLSATLNVTNSDFRDITTNPVDFGTVNQSHNITADPLLVNPILGGDFHQTALSPTRDAGTATGIGGVDLDWQARLSGSAPDIGADEYPVAPSGPPIGGTGGPPPSGSTTITTPKSKLKFKAARQHLRSHKLVFTLTAPIAVKASGKVTFSRKTVAKFSKRLHKGANKITVKLSKKAQKTLRRALRKHKTLSLRLRVTPKGAKAQTFKLKLSR